MLSAPRPKAQANPSFRPRSTDPVSFDQTIRQQPADDVAGHAEHVRQRREDADREERHASARAQVLRQPRPVEGGDRTRKHANQEQTQHLAIPNELAEGDRRAGRGRADAGRLHRDGRHPILVRKDREPRQQPDEPERRRHDERHRHAQAQPSPAAARARTAARSPIRAARPR